MFKLISMFILLFASSIVFANEKADDCGLYKKQEKMIASYSSPTFKATYQITTPTNKHMLEYYRDGNVVAYSYPSQKITEIYTRLKNGNVALIKAFDAYKRAIEYDTIDIETEGDTIDWDSHANLPSPSRMNLLHNRVACSLSDDLEHYIKRGKSTYIEMIWNKSKNLLVELELYKHKHLVYRYVLKNIEPIDQHLKAVKSYESTDFADIGDNESDPFLAKLIDLGFVSHHEVNVLDTDGHLIKTEHTSHHH